MGKDDQTSTTTTNNAPWEGQQPFLTDVYGQAQGMAGTPIQRFQGQRVGGLSANTLEGAQAGLGMLRGAGGGPGNQFLDNLIGGQMLGGNPYLDQMMQQGAADITSQFQTAVAPGMSMANIGRAGSGSEMNRAGQAYRGLGDALASNYANTYGRNYQQERAFQQQGIGMRSAFDQNTRGNIGFGAMMGQPMEQFEQRGIDEQINTFDFSQREPGARLDDYVRRIFGGGLLPGMSTQTTQTSGGGGGFGAQEGIGLGISAIGMIASMFCSRAWKDELLMTIPDKVLGALKEIEIPIWKYNQGFLEHQVKNGKVPDTAIHVGPYAEDFTAVFGVGDGKTISFIDIAGVALTAAKGAGERIEQLAEQVTTLMDRIDALEGVTGKPSHLQEVPA